MKLMDNFFYYNLTLTQKMQAQLNTLKTNCVYVIQNRKTKKYLSYDLTAINPNDNKTTLKQLWVLIKKDVQEYQIVQMINGDPLTWVQQQENSIKALKRRLTLTPNNIWSIKQAQMHNGKVYYWIKPHNNQNRCLHSSSMNQNVKVSNIDPTFQICLWHFKQFELKGQNFNGITSIQSPSRKYAMGLSTNISKQNSQINLEEMTTYGNQLWLIEPYNNNKQSKECSFIIRNFYSRLLVTLNRSHFGCKIVQSCFNNLQNQRWILQMTHKHYFYIKSSADHSMYLGFTSEKKGERLIPEGWDKRKEWIIQSNSLNSLIEGTIKISTIS